ncbi:MAG: hypothetical protein JSW62_03075, partial [Thermoplasmatales archaeon]
KDPMNIINGYYNALSVGNGRVDSPDGFENMKVPINAFDEGIKKGILDKVETIPTRVARELIAEWNTRDIEAREKEAKKVIPFPEQKKEKK